MKKILLMMVLVLPFVFQSCSKDDDDDDGVSLVGTTWVCKMTIEDYSFEITIKVLDDKRFQMTYSNDDDVEIGTYVISGSKITITMYDEHDQVEESLSGTINGNKMTFVNQEEGFEYIFVKK
jgi:major membrane immunogen (membrane-anchored lipoprotein)